MRSLVLSLVICAAVNADPGPPSGRTVAGPVKPATLSKDQAKLLDSLVREFLFDPRGAIRVRVPATGANASPDSAREAWLVEERGGPGRVYFADGASIPAPPRDKIHPINFVTSCRERYLLELRTGTDVLLVLTNWGRQDDPHLARAAWLHRLGRDDLAAKALALAGENANETPRDRLRRELAEFSFTAMQDAFSARADDEAIAHGEQLLCVFADVAEARHPHAATLLADLMRRRAAGTLGRQPPRVWPNGFEAWDLHRKVTYLIDSLDEIDAEPNRDGPGTFNNRWLPALQQLGEPAVPALLDAAERDNRLSRMPERERGGCLIGRTGRFISVREHAMTALTAILRVSVLDPTGPDPVSHTVEARAARVRRYWETYGGLPFDERMMAVLTNPDANWRACREAAQNLARVPRQDYRGWDRRTGDTIRTKLLPNPAVTKFERPTAAEAMLAACSRERTREDVPASERRRRWTALEEDYLEFLVDLGDPRIGPELSRQAAEADNLGRRRRLAFAAHRLGASSAWQSFTRDVERGTLAIAGGPRRRRTNPGDQLGAIVSALMESGQPDDDRALHALANPDHPMYPVVTRAMLDAPEGNYQDRAWRQHPYCLTVLRRGLDESRPTGRHFYLRGDEIEVSRTRPPESDRLQLWLDEALNNLHEKRSSLSAARLDRKDWNEHAEEQSCDMAATRLVELVAGIPQYHPLQREAEQSLARLKGFLDRNRGRFRLLTEREATRLDPASRGPVFVPDIRPLGRAATAADVAAGRAVFHLDGKGRPADIQLPAWAVPKTNTSELLHRLEGFDELRLAAQRNLQDGAAAEGLIVQAETGDDGKVVYGVIFRHEIRKVAADEIERVEAYRKE